MEDNVLFFESHYEVLNAEIVPEARNIASEATIKVLNSVLDKMGISEDYYEIKLTIPKNGCYQDTIKIKFNSEKILPWISLLVALWPILFSNKYDEANKKLDLAIKTKNLGVDCDTANFQGILREVCEDIDIKKALSKKYQALNKDENLKSENLIVKKDNTILSDTKIQRSQFKNFDYVAEEKIYSENFDKVIIELVSPVLVDNSKRLWVGIYQGSTIKRGDIPVLIDGDIIYFSVEDDGFKHLMQNKEISFTQGDFVYANLLISGILNFDYNVLKKKKITALSIYKTTGKETKQIKIDIVDKQIKELELFNYMDKSKTNDNK